MELETRVQIWDKAVYILLHTNALRKSINPFVLPSTMDNMIEQIRFFGFGKATTLEGKLLIQTSCTLLKN